MVVVYNWRSNTHLDCHGPVPMYLINCSVHQCANSLSLPKRSWPLSDCHQPKVARTSPFDSVQIAFSPSLK